MPREDRTFIFPPSKALVSLQPVSPITAQLIKSAVHPEQAADQEIFYHDLGGKNLIFYNVKNKTIC